MANLALSLLMALGSAVACGGSTSNTGSGGQTSTGGQRAAGGAPAQGGANSGSVVAAGSSATGGSAGISGSPSACQQSSECAWGEIAQEILKKTDCVCLLGCPFLPLSRATVERRAMQYKTLCTPGKDGQGLPCPIDDCIEMPPLACVNGQCARP